MIDTDLHTHSKFSADGRCSLGDLIRQAIEAGLTHLGVSEHFNYDYDRLHLHIDGKAVPPIDEAAYFSAARQAQRDCADRLFPHYCDGRSKAFAYNAYLYRVLESLDAQYPYDIVAHIGYCSRNATYPDPKLRYADFSDVLDEILRRIIRRGKILEVNTSSKTAGSDFLPDTDILYRYFELGGRAVSFGSDAHDTWRVGEKRELVCAALKKIGFTHLTLPRRGEHISLPL